MSGVRWTFEEYDAWVKDRQTATTAVKSDKVGSERPRKYRNQPVEFDGEKFDSKKEATVYQQLRIRQRIGEISELKRQFEFPLFAAQRTTGILMIVSKYIADFVYLEDGKRVVVDVKSDITRKNKIYALKKAWLLAQDGIEIQEV